jgi:hypothetical protein
MNTVLAVGVSVIGTCKCIGTCERYKFIKAAKNYKINKYCSECMWWLKTEEVRCRCCKQILRTTSKNKTYERKQQIQGKRFIYSYRF